jgi:dynein heavy chain
MDEWRLFLAGPQGEIKVEDNPTDWLQELEWQQVYKQLYCMDQLPAFKGITDYFKSFNKKFKKIFDSEKPHEEKLPGEWDTKLNSYQKLLILKAIRPDKVPLGIKNFIIEKIGQ